MVGASVDLDLRMSDVLCKRQREQTRGVTHTGVDKCCRMQAHVIAIGSLKVHAHLDVIYREVRESLADKKYRGARARAEVVTYLHKTQCHGYADSDFEKSG